MTKIAKSNRGGDCYQANGRKILDKPENSGWVLCHGLVTGQGKIAGLQFGHCWCEDDEQVYDYSNSRNITIPKVLYYALGNIEKVFRYKPSEVRKIVIEDGTWGPWEKEAKTWR